MKRIVIVYWLVCLAVGGAVTAQDIYSLIQTGRTDDAREALQERAGQITSDGNLLFYAAMLEPRADSAAALYEAALVGAEERFAQECFYRLTQWSCLSGRYEEAARWALGYLGKYPHGVFASEITRLQTLALEQTNRAAQALEIADLNLKKKLDRETSQRWLIDKARLLASMGKPVGASSILNRLTTEADGEAVPPALYMLAATNLRGGKAEQAGRYYALMFEGFPLAVGLGSLEDQISSAPPPPVRSDQAEQITSTYYSVKVGVFSSADNARAQAAVFTGQKPVDIVRRTIKGKVYHIVYVGKFQEYDSAAKLRGTLEQQTGEKYEVAAR